MSKDFLKELDIVELRNSVYGNEIGNSNNSILLPKGSIGTVVLIYYNQKEKEVCEVEFYVNDIYVLATVKISDLRNIIKFK